LLMMRFCSLNLSYSSTSESRKVYWYHIASPGTKIQENGRPLVNIDKKNLVTLTKPVLRVDNTAVYKRLRENGENSPVISLNYASNLAFVPVSP
jgi:hypothetical protein